MLPPHSHATPPPCGTSGRGASFRSEIHSIAGRGMAKSNDRKSEKKDTVKASTEKNEKRVAKTAPVKKSTKPKKKKRSSSDLHRQVQDSLQMLPFVIDQQKKQGHPVRAFMIRFVSAPVLKVMNKALNAKRYRGKEGEKLRQTDQMRRHLEQKGAALKHVQTQMQSQQRKRKTL